MMSKVPIPQTYEQWRHCITVVCNQPLTRSYIDERIQALSTSSDHMTSKFRQLYGEAQWQQTLAWFQQARREL